MEHVKLSDTDMFPLATLPFVGELWDGGSFDGYPERRGFDPMTQKFYAPGVENSLDASYAFYQTWFYLGILPAGFMCDNPNELLIRQDDETGEQVLTTAHLAEIANNYLAALRAMDLPDRLSALTTSIQVITKVNRSLQEPDVPNPDDLIWDDNMTLLGEKVRFGLALLCDSLSYATEHMCGHVLEAEVDKYNSKVSRANELPYVSFPYFIWQIGNSLDEAMDRALLCAVEKAQFKGLSPMLLCYILSIPETNRFPGQHDECENGTCRGNNVDDKTYVTKHVDDDCSCEHDGPEIEDVKKCLEDGHIPSLTLSIVDGEYVGMKVKPQKNKSAGIWSRQSEKNGLAKSLDYVALSHVWSDGLGNPFANTLPRCQLRRLAYYANYTINNGKARGLRGGIEKLMTLDRHTFAKRQGSLWGQRPDFEIDFWTDTLCVPLDNQYRKLAIKNMNNVYRQARYVMVLDASIAQHEFRTDMELMGRLMLSTWMKRVWTLQEAILGLEKLAICFKNDVIDQTDAVERLRSHVLSGEETIINSMLQGVGILGKDDFAGLNGAVSIMEYNKGGFKFSEIGLSRGDKEFKERQFTNFIERLWSLVGRRATTKEEDRVLVACNIMFKDVGKVLKGGGHTGRLIGLLQQLDEVPAGCIFQNGERVPVEGYRWASHYFKPSVWGRFDFSNPGRVTPEGLMVRFKGGILPVKPTGRQFTFLMTEPTGEQTLYLASMMNGGANTTDEELAEIVGRDANLAIIMSPETLFVHTIPLKGGGVVPCQQYRSVLVSITAEKNGCIWCQFGAFAWLSKAPGLEYDGRMEMVSDQPSITIDALPPSQQWCLG
ncbi:hypothetical protein DRE_02707 [Drechslerella stenobrocha 248]|uniref:Heterokaryon incompatibility domain-containing protein n=1 Tax=Drechslerella stenobrocha 248 TaxID=1043628 RepID=W7I738_9PEZI|nr:hypothetical protein DRE_02707 [Drechslerella stenobrocha 248]